MTLIEVLEELDIPFRESGHHHCREGWVQIDCPLCSFNQSRWLCGLNLHYNYANCWQCGSMKLEYVILNSVHGLSKSKLEGMIKDLDRSSIITKEREGKLELPDRLYPLLSLHRKYLKQRKFDPDNLEKTWKIKSLTQRNDALSWRLFIPIYKYGNIVAWTARTPSPDVTPRYYFAKDEQCTLPCKSLLYGEDFARQAIIVVEGPFDVWRIGPGAVCTFGIDYSTKQLERISKYPKRIICFDSEPVAQSKANQLAGSLAVFPGETSVVELETGKDPDTASVREIKELRSMLQ